MEARSSYCFEYLVTKAKMPRQRTCCPFMQRTLYRVSRNLARMDLGFTCPDIDSANSHSPADSPKRRALEKKKKKREKRQEDSNSKEGNLRRGSSITSGAGGVIQWLVRGTLGTRKPSMGVSESLETGSPMEEQEDEEEVNDNDTLDDPEINNALDMEEETTECEPQDHLLLKQKRKLLRRQRIYEMDSSLDAANSGNWPEEKSPTMEMHATKAMDRNIQPTPQPPVRSVHIKRLHARRISSTSQAGQNSIEQIFPHGNPLPPPPPPPPPQNPHHPLQATPEIDDWSRERNRDKPSHTPFNAVAPLQTPTHKEVSSIPPGMTAIPPFSVREPVEKQVRNWLESTSNEYDILLKRWSGRTNIAKSKNSNENRSLELRHQPSGESAKRMSVSGSDASHKKQLPRLWKQTTPMSHAIIQNHLEHQHQSFGRSPTMKELTVPCFGFDSGEMSMLQSLEENPEEDIMSLLPPVSSQRRFSDNPLMAKQRGGCAYQPMMSPVIINYSTRNLEPNEKMRSAPARSFCCIYHKRHGYDKPYHSPNCTCSCSQLRKNPTSSSYTEMVMMGACCQSPHNSEVLHDEEFCSGSRHGMNRLNVTDDGTNEGGINRCFSPLPHSITPRNLGSPPFLASPYRNPGTQERLSRKICRDRLTQDRDSETPFFEMMTRNETFEQELQRRLDLEVKKDESEEVTGTPQAQTSRLIPPDLVFSPASRRVSAVDIGETIGESSTINMLSINSPSRQLSRQNSIYSMEDASQHAQPNTLSPQGSLCSDRATFLTPEYPTVTPAVLSNKSELKQWVKPARSFDHFGRRNFGVHRASSHSPSHLSREHSGGPSAHKSDTECFARSPKRIISENRLETGEANSIRTPEFLSLDSSNSDPQHLEVEFYKEHRHSYNPETSAPPNYHYDNSSAEGRRPPFLLQFKPTSLTTSADCIRQQSSVGPAVVLSAEHHRGSQFMNSHLYREAANKRLAQKKKLQRAGKDMHPRKSLEVESNLSSSQSNSLQSPVSRYSRSKSSEADIRSYVSPSKTSMRRDYTIDEKTDEIFQTFLQHDPLMDDMTPQKGRKKSLQHL